MSNLVNHAKHELEIIGMMNSSDEMNAAMANHIVKMVEIFAEEGHSGSSAAYAWALLKKLLAFEPLAPLQGTDDEWTEVMPDRFRNRRCSHVFKVNGEAYDTNGKIFRDPDGSTWINGDSRVPITFPYIPKSEIVDRPA